MALFYGTTKNGVRAGGPRDRHYCHIDGGQGYIIDFNAGHAAHEHCVSYLSPDTQEQTRLMKLRELPSIYGAVASMSALDANSLIHSMLTCTTPHWVPLWTGSGGP